LTLCAGAAYIVVKRLKKNEVETLGSMCFYVSSVTNAIRGKELLDKNGIRAHISRLADENIKNGCGYCIFVSSDCERAESILRSSGIRIRGARKMNDLK
jgi:hypothetical protein